jgi:DnaJ-class molecular chaperone
LTRQKYVRFSIPPGIHNNQAIQLDNMGNLMPDGVTRGDLIFTAIACNLSENGLFKRQGDNLQVIFKISLKDAIMGYKKKVLCKHMDGRTIRTSQTPGKLIQPNKVKVLKGEGMPIHKSSTGEKGDLFVQYEIQFPEYVNVPTDSASLNAITLLFETPEERQARENTIVIDDDLDDDSEDYNNDASLDDNISSTNNEVPAYDDVSDSTSENNEPYIDAEQEKDEEEVPNVKRRKMNHSNSLDSVSSSEIYTKKRCHLTLYLFLCYSQNKSI